MLQRGTSMGGDITPFDDDIVGGYITMRHAMETLWGETTGHAMAISTVARSFFGRHWRGNNARGDIALCNGNIAVEESIEGDINGGRLHGERGQRVRRHGTEQW